MIAKDFVYYRPDTLPEAVDAFLESKSAAYYSGGSEIITMCRAGSIAPDAVIDIKGIPECGVLCEDDQGLRMGAACTLDQIGKSERFPLMRLACGRIADHTNQCRITLGGNLCGTIIYRETSLPLMIADAWVTLFGPEGRRRVSFDDFFDGRPCLAPGEMIVEVRVPAWALSARNFHVKKTANEKIDYPLVNVTAIERENTLRAAFSGVCGYPFRRDAIDAALSDRKKSIERRAEDAIGLLPGAIIEDARASSEYRRFALKLTLKALLEEWENGSV